MKRPPVNEKKATESSDSVCQTCGKVRRSPDGLDMAVCTCTALLSDAAWPNLSRNGTPEMERTAKFQRLKEAGTGTLFLPVTSDRGPMAPAAIDLAPGAIIGGVYQIIDLLGRGGMGEVYSAMHLPLDKKCALKVIPPSEVTDVGWQRFQQEAKIVSKLEHVNLVRVTDLGLHEDCLPYYAMEFLEGQNLAEVIADQGPMDLNYVLEIFVQVCDGVECAHRGGVLHRDLKPANIMLTHTPTGKLEVKILDFGLAKVTRHDRYKQSLTGIGDVFGSPCYMSPEQCSEVEIDSRSDIYSIGCTMFECLTGGPPFNGTMAAAVFFGHLEAPPPTLQKAHGSQQFPEMMEAVMARLLRKNPAERYQTLSEVKAALERVYQNANGLSATQESLTSAGEQSTGVVRRRTLGRPHSRLWLYLTAAAFVALVGAAAYNLYGQEPIDAAVSLNFFSPRPAAPPAPQTARAVAAALNIPAVPATASAAGYEALHVKPFYLGLSMKDGKQCQHWQYLGHRPPPLYFVYEDVGETGANGAPQNKSSWTEVPLTGDVYLPQGLRLCVMPKRSLVHAPPLTDGLKGAVLDDVDYEWYSFADVQAANKAFAQCPSIKGLQIGNYSWSKDEIKESIALINQFPNLDRLTLDIACDGAQLAQIDRWKDLHELRLNASHSRLHDCLGQLGLCRNLNFLVLLSWGAPSSELSALAQCTHLKRLMIGQLTGSKQQLQVFGQLPLLERLDLPALHYRPDLAADLQGLKSLKALKFFRGNDWNEYQLAQLKHDLPGVDVSTYADVRALREAFWLH